jgi:Tol biopolymer transport system component
MRFTPCGILEIMDCESRAGELMKLFGLALLWLMAGGLRPGEAAPASTNNEAQFLSNTRQLIFEGRRSGEGYFSSDGQALIFQSEREAGNPFYQIYLLDLLSGETHRVSPGLGKTTCSFFRPGSDEVLFSSTHLDPQTAARQKAELEFRAAGKERRYSWDYDEQMDIFSAHRDGSHLVRLTQALGYDAEASYSPDGRQIVFCSLRDAYPTNQLSAAEQKQFETNPAWFGELYIMDADGSHQRRLTHWPGYDGGPFFSPDGRRILWRHFDEQGKADIYTMNLAGEDIKRLTDFGCMSWAPFYHPSSQYVLFTANKLGFANFELFLVDINGRHQPVRVTYTDGFDGLPVFSPDGQKLCWTSGRTPDGKAQLFLAEWNHEAAVRALELAPLRQGSDRIAEARPQFAAAHPPEWAASEALVPKLQEEVTYLASDALAGRMTGSPGAHAAADYLAEHLREAGLVPLGVSNSWFQPFTFTAGIRVVTNQNSLTLWTNSEAPASFEVETDFRPLSFTANDTVEGALVFAGYGLTVPGDKASESYDSYAGLDVTNKIALVLRYVPEDVEPKRRAELNLYSGLRYKALLARQHGARAVLFVTGPNSPNAGKLTDLSFDGSLSGSGIVAASISSNVVQAILAPSGKDLKTLQTALDKENPHAAAGFLIPVVKLKLATLVEHLKKTDRNVLGLLPPAGVPERDEFVLVSAHYDHLGLGEAGSMRLPGEEGKIHYGADDNASGTAAVLTLAASLAKQRALHSNTFHRGILFACWSGEELGLLGSSWFGEHPPVPLSNIVANLNFDMVGRLRENKLILQGVGSSSYWRPEIEKRNVVAGFSLTLQEDPYLPTDVTTFYPKHIPVLNFFTGSHEDYHRPTDTAERLNYEGLARIIGLAQGILTDLAVAENRPDYAVVQHSASPASRENLRAYLGTIPDYSTEVTGVKLSGVRADSPAAKAGLQGGDIIVEFGGQKITNIYDYTYALDAVKIGQPVKIVVQRHGQPMQLTATPEARK